MLSQHNQDTDGKSALLEIIEILGPSEQGYQKPYLCRADNNLLYYVKGRQTTRADLLREWVCAHLAKALALPQPNFAIVNIDDALLSESPQEWRELGSGPAFGSQQHPSAIWFEISRTESVPPQTRKDILMFDYWIKNLDRQTGNTNMLWDSANSKVVIIDHNLAFDTSFTVSDFLKVHVFRNDWSDIDMVERDAYAARFCQALPVAHAACNNSPPEWQWIDPEQTVEATHDQAAMIAQLERCKTNELWMPT